jgi:hypothetical protein
MYLYIYIFIDIFIQTNVYIYLQENYHHQEFFHHKLELESNENYMNIKASTEQLQSVQRDLELHCLSLQVYRFCVYIYVCIYLCIYTYIRKFL